MILVTGCTGYIGSRLVLTLLKSGQAVRGLVLPHEIKKAVNLSAAGMQLWEGDLLVQDTLDTIGTGVTVVYHLAGLHSTSIQRMREVYVQGTRNLVQALMQTHLYAFVAASNASVYGDCGDEWVTEEHIPSLIHPFGQVTLQMEQVLTEAYRQVRFPSIILRIAEVYGPDEYDLLKKVRTGNLRLLGNGSNWNSHIHIDDLVTILSLVPHRLRSGEIYNVADDFPVQQKIMYNDISTRLGVNQPKWLSLEMVPEKIKLSIHSLRALSTRLTNEKIKSALELTFCYPTYQEGIETLL